MSETDRSLLTPREIVSELDKYIVGQQDAKRAVAVALRNRWRRSRVPEPLHSEITPKNILMIGPTGVGKTEIARRLAKLTDAPFVKTEATKFTEVGYVGRNVESIVRDLMQEGVKLVEAQQKKRVMTRARELAEERVLDLLLPPPAPVEGQSQPAAPVESTARRRFREDLRAGRLDEKTVEADVASNAPVFNMIAPEGMDDLENQLQNVFEKINAARREKRRLKIKEVMEIYTDEEAGKLIDHEDLTRRAIESVENNGIVFIDEIDKIAGGAERHGSGDVSREGVQRDLLPLIEGTSVKTKYGWVKTDHVLFICSGAFHLSKPSDLVPELQGRLPIRVELKSLTEDDFVRILTETDASVVKQYEALLGADGAKLVFTPEAIRAIAHYAYEVNERTENIGARRLYTVMEKLLEEVSFEAGCRSTMEVTIDEAYVRERLETLAGDQDLSRFVL